MTPSDQGLLLLRKAAQDLAVLEKLINDPEISDETLGYHAQQAAEKCLKALLASRKLDYPRSHSIGLLLDLLEAQGFVLPQEFQELELFTPFGTIFRYDELPLEEPQDRSRWPLLIKEPYAFAVLKVRDSGD